MKCYRKALCVPVLALVLASSAFAGDIQHPLVPPAPLTANGEIQQPVTSDDEMPTDDAESSPEAADPATKIALTVLQSLLTLF